MDLLNQTYRKMEYQNLIQVSDSVEKYFVYSQSYPNFLVMLARSYHFTGQYEKALKVFQKIVNDYADAEEFQESLFRSGWWRRVNERMRGGGRKY
jgi:TolA-binding protein